MRGTSRSGGVVAGLLLLIAAVVLAPMAYASGLDLASRAAPKNGPGKPELKEPKFSTGFRLPASNGYTLYVSAIALPKKPGKGLVGLTARSSGAESTYGARGTVTPKRIAADFGPLGSVQMSLHRRRGMRRVHPNCGPDRHRHFSVQNGVWRGSVSFSGEGGYTAAAASVAKPTYLYGPIGCESVIGGDNIRSVALNNLGMGTSFDADQNRGPGTAVRFFGLEVERSVPISIVRQVWSVGGPETFSYDAVLTTATVAPPPPFSGQATFQREDRLGNGTLSGTLAATFPGGPTVNLTGPSRAANLSHSKVTMVP